MALALQAVAGYFAPRIIDRTLNHQPELEL
jgi:hypothetical protein